MPHPPAAIDMDAARALRAEGLSYAAVAAKIGARPSTLQRRLSKEGPPPATPAAMRAVIEGVSARLAAGETVQTIAQHLGVRVPAVRELAREADRLVILARRERARALLGLADRLRDEARQLTAPERGSKCAIRVSEAELHALYAAGTIQSIADRFGVSYGAARNALLAAGVELRERGTRPAFIQTQADPGQRA